MGIMYFLVGLGSWIILEYFMHRFVLHKFGSAHQYHHENPKDIKDLFVSWKYVAAVSVGLCGLALLVLSPIQVMLFYLGVVLGYSVYELIHYRVHHCKVKTKLMKYLRKHHLRHHYANEDTNFSVVFPPLDALFRTKSDRSR